MNPEYFLDPKKTVVIIIDTWDHHWCQAADQGLEELAPRIEQFLEKIRLLGVRTIHAPAQCMDFYEGTPARKLSQISSIGTSVVRVYNLLGEPRVEPRGYCGCTSPCSSNSKGHRTRQHPQIQIMEGDAVTDKGEEVLGLLQRWHTTSPVVVGIHSGDCVLYQPYGLRSLTLLGYSPILIWDLSSPFLPPGDFLASQALRKHIEKYISPVVSQQEVLRMLVE